MAWLSQYHPYLVRRYERLYVSRAPGRRYTTSGVTEAAPGGDRARGGAQLGRVVAEERDHRGHQDPAVDAVLGEGAYELW